MMVAPPAVNTLERTAVRDINLLMLQLNIASKSESPRQLDLGIYAEITRILCNIRPVLMSSRETPVVLIIYPLLQVLYWSNRPKPWTGSSSVQLLSSIAWQLYPGPSFFQQITWPVTLTDKGVVLSIPL